MVDNPLSTIFAFIGTFYGLVIPLLAITLLALLYIAGMSAPGAKAREVGEAIICYMLHAVSVLLMTVGALPTVFSVFAGIAYSGRTYIALLMVFAVGGLLFLIQDQTVRSIDSASRSVIEGIYMATIKLIGIIVTLLSSLSLLLGVVLGSLQQGWWVVPFTYLLFGTLLSWCTRSENDMAFFRSMKIASTSPVASKTSRLGKMKMKRKK